MTGRFGPEEENHTEGRARSSNIQHGGARGHTQRTGGADGAAAELEGEAGRDLGQELTVQGVDNEPKAVQKGW